MSRRTEIRTLQAYVITLTNAFQPQPPTLPLKHESQPSTVTVKHTPEP